MRANVPAPRPSINLRAPRTSAERSALEALKGSAAPRIANAVTALRRHHALPEVTGSARILVGPRGPEAVMVIRFFCGQAVDFGLVAHERRMQRYLRDELIHAGLAVGGVPCFDNEVVFRGQVIAAETRRAA